MQEILTLPVLDLWQIWLKLNQLGGIIGCQGKIYLYNLHSNCTLCWVVWRYDQRAAYRHSTREDPALIPKHIFLCSVTVCVYLRLLFMRMLVSYRPSSLDSLLQRGSVWRTGRRKDLGCGLMGHQWTKTGEIDEHRDNYPQIFYYIYTVLLPCWSEQCTHCYTWCFALSVGCSGPKGSLMERMEEKTVVTFTQWLTSLAWTIITA